MRKLLSVITAAACLLLYPAAAFADTENSVGAELAQPFAAADPAVVLNVVPVEEGSSEAMVSVRSEYKETLTEIDIPETINGYKIVAIDTDGFRDCTNLVSVKLPKTINQIFYFAFSGCESLTSINIPEGVTMIYYEAFSYCKNLVSIKLPNTLDYIYPWVFFRCENLVSIDIPDSVAHLGYCAFLGCSNLVSVKLPEGIKKIEYGTFNSCSSLESIVIPEGVTEIGSDAFERCGLKSVTLPQTLETIWYGAFDYCSELSSITFPDSVKIIEREAFYKCESLESITIPGSVEQLGENAFGCCSDLNTVVIHNGITEIPTSCFSASNNIKTVYLPLSVKSIGSGAFYSDEEFDVIYFGGTEDQWKEVQIDPQNNENFLKAPVIFLTPAPDDPNPGDPFAVAPVFININIPKQDENLKIKDLKASALDTANGNTVELPIDDQNRINVAELENGSYTLTVSAKQCAKRSYSLTVTDEGISGNAAGGVELHLYGDADGDGRIYYYDIMIANDHAKGISLLTGYDFAVCDINQDGKVNIQDAAKINLHWARGNPLWN